MKIILRNKINNDSLQVGDVAYYITPTTPISGINNTTEDPLKIGEITKVGENFIKIDSVTNTPTTDDFIMFQKNITVNNSSLLGYYAEVKLKNNSEDKAELFSLGSEIVPSSK